MDCPLLYDNSFRYCQLNEAMFHNKYCFAQIPNRYLHPNQRLHHNGLVRIRYLDNKKAFGLYYGHYKNTWHRHIHRIFLRYYFHTKYQLLFSLQNLFDSYELRHNFLEKKFHKYSRYPHYRLQHHFPY